MCTYIVRRKRKEDMLLQESVHTKPSKNQVYWSKAKEWSGYLGGEETESLREASAILIRS